MSMTLFLSKSDKLIISSDFTYAMVEECELEVITGNIRRVLLDEGRTKGLEMMTTSVK